MICEVVVAVWRPARQSFYEAKAHFPERGLLYLQIARKQKKKHVSSDGITNPVFCKIVFVYLVRYKKKHTSNCVWYEEKEA